ncbi:MAG: divalent metal cation transporter [Ignavibacteria bacterium]|jgi:NRAMP (natural resistance-associated macrophage protein)-like metal ion transporter|nr:divalent metal cation transporter [Ignavibacteria bacterium]MCU7499337.1 divalent metal cation transporter [Ignavibacteria bacterium]MCU7511317.1 divalent metal cation transporter [Ignavibacteria bacterium]MCU7518961.1 divalent metal cation transporter [Ignavibacteria bacterium]MCU7525804.1 divalent metal cation transporter [Ignavibacteria bacterium]
MNKETEFINGISTKTSPGNPFKNFLKRLGPGVITGASDDDPSAIATFSQAGAHFSFNLLWTVLYTYPLKSATQEISARIGRVTGRGLAGNMLRYYPPWISIIITSLMIIANVINIGADIAAMGSAMNLLIGGPEIIYSILLAALSLVLQVFIPYTKYVKILKWLSLALFSYMFTAFIVDVDWKMALTATVVPELRWDTKFLGAVVAVLGATISPYLFFWQASQETEEVNTTPEEEPLKVAPRQAPEQMKRIKIDTYLGMAFSNIIIFFIIVTTAMTLNTQGITEVNSAAEAAGALKPLAGRFASLLFSAGIIGTGMLAIPILGGSSAYAIGELFKWPVGLEQKPFRAVNFYLVLSVATLLGLALNFTPINPIQALIWAATINGLIAAPVMIIMMLMSSNRMVMGRFIIPAGLRIGGWVSVALMTLAALGLIYSWVV